MPRPPSDKIAVSLYIPRPVRQWFHEHDMELSAFFLEAFSVYIDGDVDAKSKIIGNQIRTHLGEVKRLEEEYEECTGKKWEQCTLETVPTTTIRSKEDEGLHKLYRAMSEDQKHVLRGRAVFSDMTMAHVRNWIEARKDDFDLMISTDKVIEKLKDNGFSEEGIH